MKKTEFAVVCIALFLFFLIGPLSASKEKIESKQNKQEQVASDEDVGDFDSELVDENYRIVYRAPGIKENPVADIIWLKKAAQVAMDAGIPHFNVKQKIVSKQFDRRAGLRLNVVEGVIELDNDPMRAEYDAQEILSLVLPEITP